MEQHQVLDTSTNIFSFSISAHRTTEVVKEKMFFLRTLQMHFLQVSDWGEAAKPHIWITSYKK